MSKTSFIPKENSGRVFDQRQDKSSDKQPDVAGLAMVNGEMFRVVGWYNPPSERARVSSYSLRFQPMAEYEEQRRQKAVAKVDKANRNVPATDPDAPPY